MKTLNEIKVMAKQAKNNGIRSIELRVTEISLEDVAELRRQGFGIDFSLLSHGSMRRVTWYYVPEMK